MNEPSMPSQPFQPEVASAPRGGCNKVALFGCGALLLLLLVAVVVFLFKVKDITASVVGVMGEQVVERLPAETTDEDRQRVRDGFAAVVAAIHDETVDPNALQRLQTVIVRFADPQTSPTSDDVRQLIELLEVAAGTAPPVELVPEETPLAEPAL